MKTLLSTAYWPNLEYFYQILNSDSIQIEAFENYQKQSFRNRTTILTANGSLDLSIPVKKNAPKELTKNIEISYSENWQTKHWRAITSAYKNSPYFEHFEMEIESFYTQKFDTLLDYNLLQLDCICKILKTKKEILLTQDYDKSPVDCLDLREKIHPKIDSYLNDELRSILATPYYQTFENKFDFIPNLSILDLVFNKGLETLDYLKRP